MTSTSRFEIDDRVRFRKAHVDAPLGTRATVVGGQTGGFSGLILVVLKNGKHFYTSQSFLRHLRILEQLAECAE